MKFITPKLDSNFFWVENYTEVDKSFLLSIGFWERRWLSASRSGEDLVSLLYKGTHPIMGWTEVEMTSIIQKIRNKYPEFKIEKYY